MMDTTETGENWQPLRRDTEELGGSSPVLPAGVLLALLHEALQRDGRFRWPLNGSSMRPTFPSTCEIEIVPLPPSSPRLGDVLVFMSRDVLIAHRLVRRAGPHWITQGDGRLGPDPPLRPDQVLGQVAIARQNGQRFWPRAGEKARATWWVTRHHLLRPARAVWRSVRRLLDSRR